MTDLKSSLRLKIFNAVRFGGRGGRACGFCGAVCCKFCCDVGGRDVLHAVDSVEHNEVILALYCALALSCVFVVVMGSLFSNAAGWLRPWIFW